jgi:hypothetical protein
VTPDRVFTIAVAAIVLHLVARAPIADPDLGWQLRVGEWIWQHGALPATDPFAYPNAGRPWIVYSWIGELAFWLIASHVGFHALVLACATVVAATFVVVLRAAREAGAAPTVAYAATVVAALATAPYTSERPGMASFLLAAVYARTLLRWRRGESSAPWMLVPLMALWANVHVFFIFGLAWLWATVAWTAAESMTVRRALPDRRWRGLLAVAAAASAVTLVNPYGWRLLAHVIEISRHPVAIPAIVEFSSPDFHAAGLFVLPLLLMLVAALAAGTERPDPFLTVLVAGHLALALVTQRYVPLLGILAAPLVGRSMTTALRMNPRGEGPFSRLHAVAHAAIAFGFVVLAATAVPTHAALDPNLRPGEFPVDAARFLRRQPNLGRLLNSFNWGGYLIYALYPDYQVSIDGRTTVYGEDETLSYLDMQFVRDGWGAYLAHWHPDVVLWERQGALAVALGESPAWVRVYADDTAVVFLRADHPLRAEVEAAGQEPAGWQSLDAG